VGQDGPTVGVRAAAGRLQRLGRLDHERKHLAVRSSWTWNWICGLEHGWCAAVTRGSSSTGVLLGRACVLMGECTYRAAGATHGQELLPEEMQEVITAAGRTPWQRNTLYGPAPAGQMVKSFKAPELLPLRGVAR
jgi:hypothetical protein